MSDKGKKVNQKAFSGRDIKQVAGDNQETNHNLFIGIFFFVILALGGLAWTLTIGVDKGDKDTQAKQLLNDPQKYTCISS